MDSNLVPFSVTRLQASVPDGLPLEWQGKAFNSGALNIMLDDRSGSCSCGVLDYAQKRASAEFHVRLEFPEFARMLEAVEIPQELTQPVCAVLNSKGEILDNHSFFLSGSCILQEHGLFPSRETRASVLPGH
ncbi:MAG TPA: hypothetical protein VN517_07570 [Terriglobales bacterium]|nr:hypothetical protein [Terriglobales bacterium]